MHQLWNTNYQNNKFYGASDKCIMCSKQGKTTDHIYQCPHHEAEACRADGCRNLLTTMAKMTPDSLLTAIEILLSDSISIKLDGQHQFQQLITNQ